LELKKSDVICSDVEEVIDLAQSERGIYEPSKIIKVAKRKRRPKVYQTLGEIADGVEIGLGMLERFLFIINKINRR